MSSQRETIDRVVKLSKSMSGLGVVTVTVRDRAQSKVEGVVVRSRIDDRGRRQLRDGESTLAFTIRKRSGEEVELPVDRMSKVSLRPLHLEPVR